MKQAVVLRITDATQDQIRVATCGLARQEDVKCVSGKFECELVIRSSDIVRYVCKWLLSSGFDEIVEDV